MANESGTTPSASLWERLRHPIPHPPATKVKNANDLLKDRMSPLDRLALAITVKVGSMGFFFLILLWTIVWCGYNILASEIPSLGWKSFDPFPAFVAYLLMSNVIQILLMPLIMVGQNVQSRHAEIRSELDFEINQKAEAEVVAILRNLEHNTDLIIQLMKHLDCKISEAEIRALEASKKEMDTVVSKPIETPDV
ncbi:MAG TPA: DUF1003 domain-containing protein [Fimbriimonadaceae bacterium]|nr:DUF1003 domain-containing protein [Fimbriimonadaceae bacterium]